MAIPKEAGRRRDGDPAILDHPLGDLHWWETHGPEIDREIDVWFRRHHGRRPHLLVSDRRFLAFRMGPEFDRWERTVGAPMTLRKLLLKSWPAMGNQDPLVGSRAGAVLRRDGLAVDSPFPLGVPHEPPREPGSCPRHLKRSVRISRTPLSCRLHRTGYVTYRDGTAARSTQRHVCRRDAPRGSDSAFPEQYSRRRSVLQTTKRHYQPLLPPPSLTTTCRQQGPFARRALPRVHTTTAPSATRSSPRRFPGGSGYTTGLPPGPFALGRDGFSSCSVCPMFPCCR